MTFLCTLLAACFLKTRHDLACIIGLLPGSGSGEHGVQFHHEDPRDSLPEDQALVPKDGPTRGIDTRPVRVLIWPQQLTPRSWLVIDAHVERGGQYG